MPAMHAQTFTVLHAFTGTGGEGAQPSTGVTIQGNALYGTTSNHCGTVYQLTNTGSNWIFSTIAALSNNCTPGARVVFGPDGHLYGTSVFGGPTGGGTAFKLTPQSGPCRDVRCLWTINDIHDFDSNTEGYEPGSGDLIWDPQGNLYGTTALGGAFDWGTVYELTPSGNGYTASILYSFSNDIDGGFPNAGLVLDNQGNLFGTTVQGGANNDGTIFELSYVVGVGWTQNVLYTFQNASDGALPFAGLIFDSAGNLYGATVNGGSGGGGTVFELSPSGDTWTFNLLYSFSGHNCGPYANLAFGPDSALYGVTHCDGTLKHGNVFKLANTQNGWQYTSLHDFTLGNDGALPTSNVTFDTQGNLYGTAASGGLGNGVVWMIKP
jgi:uncharacterized repeat protein (TIGR03803 family)